MEQRQEERPSVEYDLFHTILTSGYLLKKGDKGLIKSYKRRFFTLYPNRLAYSETPHSPELGSFVINECTVVESDAIYRRYPYTNLEIKNNLQGRVVVLQAPDANNCSVWTNAIIEAVNSSVNKQLTQARLANKTLIGIVRVQVSNLLAANGTSKEYNIVLSDGKSTFSVLRSWTDFVTYHDLLRQKLPGYDLSSLQHIEAPALIQNLKPMHQYLESLLRRFAVQLDSELNAFFTPNVKHDRILFIRFLEFRNLPSTGRVKASVALLSANGKKDLSQRVFTHVVSAKQAWDDTDSSFWINCAGAEQIAIRLMLDNVPCGKIKLPFSTIPVNRSLQHWFPLQASHNSVNPKGDILISLQLHVKTILWVVCVWKRKRKRKRKKNKSPSTSDDTFKPNTIRNIVVTEDQQSERRRLLEERAKVGFAGELRLAYLYNPPFHEWPGSVTVTVMEARSIESVGENTKSCSPFVVVQVGNKTCQSSVIKDSLRPMWKGEQFFFPLTMDQVEDDALLYFELKHSDVVGSQLIGRGRLRLTEIPANQVGDGWFLLTKPPSEKSVPKNIGSKKKQEGFRPMLPVVLVPGFGSSVLNVVEGYPAWQNKRLWLSLTKLSGQKFNTGSVRASTSSADLTRDSSSPSLNSSVVLSASMSAIELQQYVTWVNCSDQDTSLFQNQLFEMLPTSTTTTVLPSLNDLQQWLSDHQRVTSVNLKVVCDCVNKDLLDYFSSSVKYSPGVMVFMPDLEDLQPVNERISNFAFASCCNSVDQLFGWCTTTGSAVTTELTSANEQEDDITFKNRWLDHVRLANDGLSDPKGIKVRAGEGKQAVSYLTPGVLTNSLSYVFGPLIEELHAFGYTDSNLVAMPYDWRVAPHYLEERDAYFTRLRVQIEQMFERHQTAVVIVGHSMGNRTIQYFLNFIKDRFGQQWIDKHIHTMMALAAPWLGAPKSVRGIISGERFGLDAFLSDSEAIIWARSITSMMSLFPYRSSLFFHGSDADFTFVRESDNAPSKPSNFRDTLELALCFDQIQWNQKYFLHDDHFGGSSQGFTDPDLPRIIEPPPVKRLYAMYGVDLKTETAYFFKFRKGKLIADEDPKEDTSKNFRFSNLVIEKGIGYETSSTKQPLLYQTTGFMDRRSGDGTVPYASLHYCTTWRKIIPELKIEELEGVDHRSILGNRLFFLKMIDFLADPENVMAGRPARTAVEISASSAFNIPINPAAPSRAASISPRSSLRSESGERSLQLFLSSNSESSASPKNEKRNSRRRSAAIAASDLTTGIPTEGTDSATHPPQTNNTLLPPSSDEPARPSTPQLLTKADVLNETEFEKEHDL